MTRFLAHLIAPLLLVCLVAAAAHAQSDRGDDGEAIFSIFYDEADRVSNALGTGSLDDVELQERRAWLEAERRTFVTLATEAKAALIPLTRQLEALGEVPEGEEEAPDLASERERLTTEIAVVDTRLKRAEQASERSAALIEQINKFRRDRLREQLLTRGPSPLSLERILVTLSATERQVRAIGLEVWNNLTGEKAMRALVDRLALPLLLAALGLMVTIGLRRWLVRKMSKRLTEVTEHTQRGMIAFGLTVARLLLPSLSVGLVYMGLTIGGLLGPTGLLLLRELSWAAIIVIGAFALGSAYFAPKQGAVRLSSLNDKDARRAHRWLIALAAVVGADNVLVVGAQKLSITPDAVLVLNAGVLILGSIALWRFAEAARIGEAVERGPQGVGDDGEEDAEVAPSPTRMLLRVARIVARIVAAFAPLLALAGYFAASRFIFYPLVFSAALIGICVLIQRISKELANFGAPPEAGGSSEGTLPALPVITGSVLVMCSLPLLALIWGANVTDLGTVWVRMVEGFAVGDVVISPVDFMFFILVFGIGYVLTKLIQGILRRSVMPVLRMDTGVKSALMAGLGYLGIIISALIAISTTGLDLSNLAIVAGALSVGIGFGLQNIVNNFVSGVILLVERPIKTGDWVTIGGVHGTVQKVNVRSTEIQTFDRSTMFVPNADLISGTVTNWTHANSHGRLIVPVGVAYGSDVRRVEKVLLEAAQGHPMLMRRPSPYVIFVGFGADSLDFEIRGVLRDVNWILNVASDIRFTVYERFQAEGIEIPFAQRDVHIRSLGGLENLLAQKPKGKGEDASSDPTPEADGSGDGPG